MKGLHSHISSFITWMSLILQQDLHSGEDFRHGVRGKKTEVKICRTRTLLPNNGCNPMDFLAKCL